jgi:1-acyl-sn-glycerol-3-phosphate acyltransferase
VRARDVIRSGAIWAGFAGVTLVAFPPMLLGYPLVLVDPNRALSDAYFRTIGRALVRLNPMWSVTVEGREHLEFGGPFVIVVNHQSLADLIVMCFLDHRTKFLGKASLFKLPIFGWMLRIAGEVSVERGVRDSGAKALRELRNWLARGVSVCLFPEGTRSKDASIAPFKLGAFKLAIEAGAPILPVVLSGAASLLPKNSLIFDQRADIRARVLSPYSTRGRSIEDTEAVAAEVRTRMMAALAELEGERKEQAFALE